MKIVLTLYASFEIRCFGKVQGVWFRYFCKKTADTLAIKGWVKNELDGSVSIKAVGNKESLEKFFFWCTEGSPLAEVARTEIIRGNEEPLKNFEIIKK